MHRNFYFAQIKEYNQMITVLSDLDSDAVEDATRNSQSKGEGLVFT